MKPYYSPSKFVHGSRQSISILSPEKIRHSFDHQLMSLNFQESCTKPSFFRHSISVEVPPLKFTPVRSGPKQEKSCIVNLKSALGQLEKKINKAKKHLNTYKKMISEEDLEEDHPPVKEQNESKEASTQESNRHLKVKSNHKLAPQKSKAYYIIEIIQSMQNKSSKAGEHLSMSLKVLRNHFKIEAPALAEIMKKRVKLEKQKGDELKKTLLIDIDETIIHCEQDSSKSHDLCLEIELEKGGFAKAFITIRPYALSFLKRMSKIFEIIAFTASHESYADVVLDEIDPCHEWIKHRLYRKHCVEIHENIYAKDLRVLNRDLSQTVLVDNAPYSYIFQVENGIPIIPYYCGEDQQLVRLEKYLQELAKETDVRTLNSTTFRLQDYRSFTNEADLIHNLYLT